MKKKIVLESSWWISFILSKSSFGLPAFFLNEKFDFYFSNELLEEIHNTPLYSRSVKRMNKVNLQRFEDFIQDLAVIVDTTSTVTICRDSKDNFLLALAKD